MTWWFGKLSWLAGVPHFENAAPFHAQLLQKISSKLALDASVGPENVSALLKKVTSVPCLTEAALGHGKELRLKGSEISGAALWALHRYVHICAFHLKGEASEPRSCWTRLSRPRFRNFFPVPRTSQPNFIETGISTVRR